MFLTKEKMLDLLLIIGVALSPMTLLRISKVGPSELFIFVWCMLIIYTYKKIKVKIDIFLVFWLAFISLLSIGTIIAAFIDAPVIGIIRDGFTYVFFTILIYSLILFYQNSTKEKIIDILSSVFIISGLLYGFLYFYSIIISQSFLGLNLWFGGVRFSGGALNPHQFAFLAGPMLFVGVYLIFNKKGSSKVLNTIYVLFSILFFILGVKTESATLLISLLLQAILLVFLLLTNFRNKTLAMAATFFITSLISLIVWLKYESIFNRFISFVESDPNGWGRFELLHIGFDVFQISPLLGLGLGAHIPKINGGVMESHNLYMEILLNSGLFGLVNLLVFLVVLNVKLWKDKIAVVITFFFIFYGFGGYGLRRILFWFLLISLFYINYHENSNYKTISKGKKKPYK